MTSVILLVYCLGALDELESRRIACVCSCVGRLTSPTSLCLKQDTLNYELEIILCRLLRTKQVIIARAGQAYPLRCEYPSVRDLLFVPLHIWVLVNLPPRTFDSLTLYIPFLGYYIEAYIKGTSRLRESALNMLWRHKGSRWLSKNLRRGWRQQSCRIRRRVGLLHDQLTKQISIKFWRLIELYKDRSPVVREALVAVCGAVEGSTSWLAGEGLTDGAVNLCARYLGIDLSVDFEGPMPVAPLDPLLMALSPQLNGFTRADWHNAMHHFWLAIEVALTYR